VTDAFIVKLHQMTPAAKRRLSSAIALLAGVMSIEDEPVRAEVGEIDVEITSRARVEWGREDVDSSINELPNGKWRIIAERIDE